MTSRGDLLCPLQRADGVFQRMLTCFVGMAAGSVRASLWKVALKQDKWMAASGGPAAISILGAVWGTFPGPPALRPLP